jgi:hypothetical protein
MLETQFLGFEVINEEDLAQRFSTVLPGQVTRDWASAGQIVSCDKVRWAVFNFIAYKSLGVDCCFPSLLQEGLEVIISLVEPILLSDIFHYPVG